MCYYVNTENTQRHFTDAQGSLLKHKWQRSSVGVCVSLRGTRKSVYWTTSWADLKLPHPVSQLPVFPSQ